MITEGNPPSGVPDVSLDMLQALMQRVIAEQTSAKRELADIRGLLLAVVDQGQRTERRMVTMERRIGETRDDIELTVKAELMRRLGHFETRIESRIDALERRLKPI